MRIAISGADGFLGSHILSNLQAHGGYDVVAITLFPEVLRARFEGWNELHIVQADLDVMMQDDALDNVDVYLACAFPRATAAEHMGAGLDFVYGSLHHLLQKGCKAVINVSSQSVYDPCRARPAQECDAVVLASTYAVAKYCVELHVAQVCGQRGVPYVNVRMASLIGPGFDQRFVNKMTKSALSDGVVRYVEGSSKHAFLDVRDAAAGLVALACNVDEKCPHTMNLGPSASYTTAELAHEVASSVTRATQKPVALEKIGPEKSTTNSELDSSVFIRATGWEPEYSVQDMLRAICDRFSVNGGTGSR